MSTGETPDSQTPDSQTPDSQTPDSQNPGSQAPDNQAPDNQAPASQTPAVTKADSPAVPADATPAAAAPVASGSEVTSPPAANAETETSATATGPLGKLVRGSGPLAARGLGVTKPASPTVDAAALSKPGKPQTKKNKPPRDKAADSSDDRKAKPKVVAPNKRLPAKVAIPSTRQALSDDLQAELDAELSMTDLDAMLSGAAGMAERAEPLEEGARVHAQVLKIHEDSVFVSLGGPDEGVVPFVHFKEEPVIGSSVEVIIRGISGEDGLYALGLPGEAVDASDWEDMEEGAVVEVTVTGNNSGGLECKVGGVKGFIPISQISEYRVEDTSEFDGQKLLCVVTEANQRRGNLVLSRRAVVEREREEKRKEQLEKMEVGDLMDGIVRSIKDFGAFVDLGGLDGLIHISKLSWDRVKHPSEVLEEGQQVKVKVDRVDKETGKISLSYRDLLENPWDTAEQDFGAGSTHRGMVTRTANFGCFVKLAPGVEGLVHISELAHHRVSRVDAFVTEGEEVEVKVLSFDRDSQKIGLSIKAVQQPPVDPAAKSAEEAEADEPPREPAIKSTHTGPLKGGNNQDTGGERFGLRW